MEVTPPTPPEPPIPEGCTLHSYIQGTGTQYIDTGVVGEKGVRAETKIEFTAIDNNVGIIGSRQAAGSYRFFLIKVFMNQWYMSIRDDYYGGYPITNTLYEIVADTYGDTNTLTVNDVIYVTSSENFSTTYNLYAFADNLMGTAGNFAKIKMYGLKLYKDDILVREFVPIKDQNNIACMYDKVTKEIFYNSGSGNFIAGEIVEEG